MNGWTVTLLVADVVGVGVAAGLAVRDRAPGDDLAVVRIRLGEALLSGGLLVLVALAAPRLGVGGWWGWAG